MDVKEKELRSLKVKIDELSTALLLSQQEKNEYKNMYESLLARCAEICNKSELFSQLSENIRDLKNFLGHGSIGDQSFPVTSHANNATSTVAFTAAYKATSDDLLFFESPRANSSATASSNIPNENSLLMADLVFDAQSSANEQLVVARSTHNIQITPVLPVQIKPVLSVQVKPVLPVVPLEQAVEAAQENAFGVDASSVEFKAEESVSSLAVLEAISHAENQTPIVSAGKSTISSNEQVTAQDETAIHTPEDPVAFSTSPSPDTNSFEIISRPSSLEIVESPVDNFVQPPSPTASTSPENWKKINRWNLIDTGTTTIVECEICHIESPSLFWCRPRPCIAEMIETELIDGLREMLPGNRQMKQPREKEYCVANSESGFKRARILKFMTKDTGHRFVKVLYIDYGKQAWVSADQLLVLPNKCYYFQYQATMCRLFGVQPVSGKWTQDVVGKFGEFCKCEELNLYLMDSVPPRNHSFTVRILRKPNDNEEVFAHDELLKSFGCSVLVSSDRNPAPYFSCLVEDITHVCPTAPDANPASWQVEGVEFFVDEDSSEDVYHDAVDEDNRLASASSSNLRRASSRPVLPITRGFDIPSGSYKLNNDLLSLKMIKIISPAEFYIAPLDPDAENQLKFEETFRQFTEELTAFYTEAVNCVPIDYSTLRDLPLAVAQLRTSPDGAETGCFYRCRVREPETQQQFRRNNQFMASDIRQDLKINIFFVDLGITETFKPATEVFLLDKKFCSLPEQVLKCCLFCTRPFGEGVRTEFNYWPPDAVEQFKKLCKFDRPMNAKILIEETDRFGIVLFDPDAPVDHQIVNHELVKLSMARSEVLWVSEFREQLRKFALAATLSNSRRQNSDVVDVESFLPAAGSSGSGTDNQSQLVSYIDPPEKGSILEVNVTQFYSCTKFPVTFPNGTMDSRKFKIDSNAEKESKKIMIEFEALRREINGPRNRASMRRFTYPPNVGDYCLAIFKEDNCLYRAEIIDTVPEDNCYHVTFVDYGNMDWVAFDKLYIIPNAYLRLPFVSLECRLANLLPTEFADSAENMNTLSEKIFRKPQKVRIIDVIQSPEKNKSFLLVDLRVMEVDNSYFNVNMFVVDKGWALSA